MTDELIGKMNKKDACANGGSGAGHHGSQHDATVTSSSGLDPKQVIALQHLLAGDTVTAAAEAAGVNRSTVHRWMREDHVFEARFNGLKRELLNEAESRLPHIESAALKVVEDALADGNVQVAIAVLKGLGTLSGARPEIGATDPARLKYQKQLLQPLKMI